MKNLLLFILMLSPMLASAQTISDVKDNDCHTETLGGKPTIVLTKEGSTLSVQLLNYEENCCTDYFNVTSSISDGNDSVSIIVAPDAEYICTCHCPFNVSFTVRDLEPNSFYLDCWWYKGMVNLTEGEPLVLEYKTENANIGNMTFILLKPMYQAMLMNWVTAAEELHIPSEVTYEGETYTVTSISKDAFWNTENATKITVPKTITSMDIDYDAAIYANPFRECKSLEWIEVEEGCPLFSSVDGVLFAKNKTMLLGYPIASLRKTYTVPEGVTNIRSGAFVHNKYLQKLVIPEEVTNLGWHLFSDTNSLEELYIKGVLEPECMNALFGDMNTKVVVYVKPSEVEKFKAVYKGPVYPLPEQIDDDIDYRPLLEEGKVWTYHYHGYNGREFNVGRIIDGDTIISGQAYKKIYDKVGGQYQYALREEGKKVYMVDDHYETESLLYDFSKDAGDVIDELVYPLIVASVDTIDIDGVKFRRMRVQDANQPVEEWDDEMINMYNFWIEGVGSECLLESSIRGNGNYYNLLSCQINGRVYTQQELLATGIDEVKTEKSKQKGQNSSVYNLYGQRINRLQKGLNIVDGRKVVVK